jgi:hypothetical protein
MTPRIPGKTKGLIALALVCWVSAMLAGLFFLQQYKREAGDAARAPTRWPVASAIVRPTDRSTLVVTIHPKCPCTRATLSELSRILPMAGEKLKTVILVGRPPGVEPGWEKTDLLVTARALPGVEVLIDDNLVQVHHFGSFTSGQALLYSPEGALLFAGGLTPERGHEGDSVGKASVLALVQGQPSLAQTSKVFGCSLDQPQSSRAVVDPSPRSTR